MNAPEISGHVELPIAYLAAEQVEQALTRFGRRPGILLDLDDVHQSPQVRSAGGEPEGPGATPLRRTHHAVCYVLDEADWYIVTGEVSPWGGMICFRR
jgi:hypothetical protein